VGIETAAAGVETPEQRDQLSGLQHPRDLPPLIRQSGTEGRLCLRLCPLRSRSERLHNPRYSLYKPISSVLIRRSGDTPLRACTTQDIPSTSHLLRPYPAVRDTPLRACTTQDIPSTSHLLRSYPAVWRHAAPRLHNPRYSLYQPSPPSLSGGQRHAAPRLHKPCYLPVLIRHGEASL